MTTSWPAKDPDWVADYRYDVALDDGDAIASINLTRLSGTVSIDSQQTDATGITAWLSGGIEGETSTFRVAWVTTGGREFDDIIVLAVRSASADVATFKLRYPALAGASDATISYWLADAARIVTDAWGDDQLPATLAFAAHGVARSDVAGSAMAQIPAGVTRFRSGSMDVAITEAAANAAASGGYDSTAYGQEFATFLRRNRGGPRLVSAC